MKLLGKETSPKQRVAINSCDAATAESLRAMTQASTSKVSNVLDQLDAESITELTQNLMRVPSVTGSAAEAELQHAIATDMTQLGAEVDLWPIDLEATLADPDFPGLEAERTEAYGMVASFGDGDGPTVILNGHVDVVPEGDLALWQHSPWDAALHDGAIYGRGACDMKGGLAAQIAVLRAIKQSGVNIRGRILFQAVASEEDGGLGTFATMKRGYTGDYALVCEPTSTNLVIACAGALTFRLTMHGKSVHAAVPDQGVNVLDKFLMVREGLRALNARRNSEVNPLMAAFNTPYPISIGKLSAGNWPSSVPDYLEAEGRLGVIIGEPIEEARRQFEAAVAEICADDPWLSEHPAEVEWSGGQFASGQLSPEQPLLDIVRNAHSQMAGWEASVQGAPYGSDLRLLQQAGIPTLHYGPGNVRDAHAPNESVPVDETLRAAQVLALVLGELCGLE